MKIRLLNSLAMGIAIALTIASSSALAAESLGNAAALQGVEQAKSVFLIKANGIAQTDRAMKAIRGTQKGLLEQGVQSEIVVVFIGKAVQFITTEPESSLVKEHDEALQSISSTAKELKSLGVRMEVCGAATKHFGVDNSSLLQEMTVVGNGFISLIGWQTQGYVPMTF
jgi:intracellular sulfur oxidation DsrE/DsrF family protein